MQKEGDEYMSTSTYRSLELREPTDRIADEFVPVYSNRDRDDCPHITHHFHPPLTVKNHGLDSRPRPIFHMRIPVLEILDRACS